MDISKGTRERSAPIIDAFFQTQESEVQAFEEGTFLELAAHEERERVVERVERDLEHQLVLGRRSEEVEDEIQRMLVDCQQAVVQNDIT